MDANRNYKLADMRQNRIYIFLLMLGALASCGKDEIKTYDIKDSAVVFSAASFSFSLRGLAEETMTLPVSLKLIGPVASYDRPISVRVADADGNTAVEGTDFTISDAVLKAGEYTASLELVVRKFRPGTEELNVSVEIVPNEHFRQGYAQYMSAYVSWSDSYVRPEMAVWRYWHLFLCPGYSRSYHLLLLDQFGDEIEKVTNSRTYANENPELIYRLPTWWYSANAALLKYVRNYDSAHPDAPLMHSEDYEAYTNYTIAVGEGKKPGNIPTIYETLVKL